MRDQEGTINSHGSRILEATGKMTQLCRKVVRIKIRWSVVERVSNFRQFFRFIWDKIVALSMGKGFRYRRLSRRPSSPTEEALESGLGHEDPTTTMCGSWDTDTDMDSDLVTLKISVLGDCKIGKTSFVVSICILFDDYV